MSARHCTAAELELYVIGALDGAAAERVESHAAECESCAAALAGEAELEIAFEQVAKQASRPMAAIVRVLRPLRAAAYGAAGLVAVAAAVMLWVSHSSANTTMGTAGGDGRGEASAAGHTPTQDGAVILDARNDALDGG
jgi:hypothetical protein